MMRKVIVLMSFLVFLSWGCSGSVQQDAKTGLSVADMVCDELTKQEQPEWIEYTCQVVDTAGKVVSVFQAKMKKEQQPNFAARYARKQAK